MCSCVHKKLSTTLVAQQVSRATDAIQVEKATFYARRTRRTTLHSSISQQKQLAIKIRDETLFFQECNKKLNCKVLLWRLLFHAWKGFGERNSSANNCTCELLRLVDSFPPPLEVKSFASCATFLPTEPAAQITANGKVVKQRFHFPWILFEGFMWFRISSFTCVLSFQFFWLVEY